MGPPGELSVAAVKTSTPVSVTSKVCSNHFLVSNSLSLVSSLIHTKLSSPFAVNSDIRPLVGPINFSGFPKSKYRFNCERHPWLAYSHCFVLAIVGNPWGRMEVGINAMATPI